jgi:NCAIR mutase (PurE)-related protein
VRRDRAQAVLERVAAGTLAPEAALDQLAADTVDSLPYATIDHDRALRQGFPEVVLAEGKSAAQTLGIAERIAAKGEGLLVTRASEAVQQTLALALPGSKINELGRTLYLPPTHPLPRAEGRVLIITAGTSDLPVAEEAAASADAFGLDVERLTDVGVAGIHRVLAKRSLLDGASVSIVVAGMDGALPSVVGGLVRHPVIAVPTSVGYGASFGGIAALLAMLNSCAAGITVVNIDNGFGAAAAAARMLRRNASD